MHDFLCDESGISLTLCSYKGNCLSLGYWNTENRVENMMHSKVFFYEIQSS